MTDDEFLSLKNRYYANGYDENQPGVATSLGTPGKANNTEQNALRWGYEAALNDIQQALFKSIMDGIAKINRR